MTTVVNNPARSSESGGYGFLLGVIAIIVLVALFVFYGVPAIRRMGPAQITVPTEIQMPDKVDVQVEQK
ncbi:hypothetical protein KBD75_00125 [Candidatus Woesebacteria bacterium]|nr:hypothetical protein [Candidatus Woesebacteria bacterium]